MSPSDSYEPVAIRGHQGWTPDARLHAASQLRSRLQGKVTVRDVAKAGAEYFQELLDARTVSISMHEDDQYRELVNIGYLPPPDSWYPAESVYPDSLFPLATQDLHEYGGYFTSDLDDPKYQEFVGSRHDPEVTSIMGIAIVTAGSLRGEVFLTRGRDQKAFDRDDLELARDLATTFGGAMQTAARKATAKARKSPG